MQSTTTNSLPAPEGELLADRWPALLKAMQDYKKQVADDFSQLAYRHVTEGIIRYDDRRRLAKASARAGIRPFDAQILIACAVRQWTLDQGIERLRAPRPMPSANSRHAFTWRTWTAAGLVALIADAFLIWCLY